MSGGMDKEVRTMLSDVRRFIVGELSDLVVESAINCDPYTLQVTVVVENDYDFDVLDIIHKVREYLKKKRYGLVLDNLRVYAIITNENDRVLRVYQKLVFDFV